MSHGDHVPHQRDVLRCLVVDPADAVLVHKHGQRLAVFSGNLGYVKQRAIHDSAALGEEPASRQLNLSRGWALAPQQPRCQPCRTSNNNGACGNLPDFDGVKVHFRAALRVAEGPIPA